MPKAQLRLRDEAAFLRGPKLWSHAVGRDLDKRTLLRVGRGHPVGLYAPLLMAGLSRGTSINRATAVGRE